MKTLAELIFDLLDVMDREATTVRDGFTTGLYWYGGHAHPASKRPRTEPAWSKRLAELLADRGVPAKCEVKYPSPLRRKSCDVVVSISPAENVWIELKTADKNYWASRSAWIYRSYLLHPLVPGLDPGKTHTVPLDMTKLATLSRTDAAHVAILLVGFDTPADPMDDDIHELSRVSGLGTVPWSMHRREWKEPYRPDLRTRCWFWHRPTT